MKSSQKLWQTLSLLLILVCISVIYLFSAFGTTEGRPIAPLDDAYITYQYARQIARGQFFRYNDGDEPTTGMTSPLFGFLLASFYRIGFEGEKLVAVAVSLGVVWLGLITLLTYRFTFHLFGDESYGPWLSAGLVSLSGALQWGCFNGMETGFFTVLTLAGLNAYFTKKLGWCTFWLSLAGLTRPEGLILTGLLFGITYLAGLRQRNISWRTLRYLAIAVFAGLMPIMLNFLLTGTYASAGLEAKSWTGNVPFYPLEVIHSIWLTFQHILFGRFLGKEWYLIPGSLLLAVWGAVRLAKEHHWHSLVTIVSWFLLGIASTSLLITALWHLGRYQVPFIPMVIILSVYGLVIKRENDVPHWLIITSWTGAMILLAASLYSTIYYRDLYQRAVNTVARQQLVLADWIRENLPQDAVVGLHDAGTLRYIGDRATYDLIGLTTPHAATPWRHGSGSVYELMEKSPMRPTHFAIYPDVFSIPYFANTDLFAEELFQVNVPNHAVASAGPLQGVWRADWHLADSGQRIYQPDILAQTSGMVLVDTLDVADLTDEIAHKVTWWQTDLIPGFPTELQQHQYRVIPDQVVLDGGRLLTGGISFELATRPGIDLWLVARLHAREAGAVQVTVGENFIGSWAYPAIPGQWLETYFHIPAAAITGETSQITLEIDNGIKDFRHYALYYVWALQGEVSAMKPPDDVPVNAALGDTIVLQGYNLAKKVWRTGDMVPVNLIWMTKESTTSPAKVFFHLYDSTGILIEQSDGWAYYGTRPPYTWHPGEYITDPRYITLPPDINPGIYTLECGLYDDTGRLPAYADNVRQPEERIVLTSIEVQNTMEKESP